MKPPMDPNIPDDPLDRELEEYLSGRSDISQQYRSAASQEPPAELDRAILAQARTSVESATPKVVRFPTRKVVGWIAPFAAAAGVLLTLSIVNQTGLQPVTLQEQRAVLSEPVLPVPTAGPPSPSVVEREMASLVESPAAPAPVADISAEKAKVENVIVDPPPVELPRAVNMPLKAQPPQQLFKTRASERRAMDSAAAGAMRQEAVATTSSVAPAPPPPLESKKDVSEVKLRDPKDWLEDIRKLRAEGKQVETQAQLKLFLEAYPDYFQKNPDVARP